MKVISIKEPFASLIKDGIKTVETRSWKTNYRGEIYIHASKTKVKMDERNTRLLAMVKPSPGYILCKCNLVDCIYMDEDYLKKIKNDKQSLYGYYEVGRYAWILDNVEVLPKPIKANGKLGIWNYEVNDE